jgi:Ca2+-binding RTX toxin-like protein
MANVTFNFDAKFGFSLIDISTNGSPYSSSQQYSWVTPYGAAKVVFLGAGFAFDDDGYPSGGTVSQMTVNVSGGDVDMTVTGLSFDFKELSEEGYTKAQMYTILWHLVLAGDDLIDFSAILPNANAFQGTAFAGDGAGAGPEAVVEGGNDKIIGQFSFGTICGDLMSVSEYSSLHGGDDTIEMSGDANGKLFGDTTDVWGSVVGGNDRVSGGVGISKISGDVSFVSLGASLVGGDDTLNLTAPGTAIGDVEISFGGMISAGNDTISGSKGSDVLSGDIIRCDYRDYLRPGDDVIHGNGGDDQILGDWQEIEVGVRVKSTGTGNDLLYGDAGNDTVSGNSGNDVIFGGSGDDVLNIPVQRHPQIGQCRHRHRFQSCRRQF